MLIFDPPVSLGGMHITFGTVFFTIQSNPEKSQWYVASRMLRTSLPMRLTSRMARGARLVHSGPLSHLRVLDLSRVLAGPWAAQALADLGAEVIKVERPGVGDDTRGWGPPFVQDAAGNRVESAYYLSANRGKKSLALDMSSPDGQRVVRDLAAKSDVVIENFKVGGLARYGLDYESLRKVNPAIVYCSITGFGQSGPLAKRAGYDFLVQAMGGLMSVTGEKDGLPGAGPQKVGVALTDILTGLYTTIGCLSGLARRDRTGEGCHVDCALLDVTVAAMANQALSHLVSGAVPTRLGNAHPSIVPYSAFAAADQSLIIAVGNDSQFAKMAETVGLPHLAADARCGTRPRPPRARRPTASSRQPALADPQTPRSLPQVRHERGARDQSGRADPAAAGRHLDPTCRALDLRLRGGGRALRTDL